MIAITVLNTNSASVYLVQMTKEGFWSVFQGVVGWNERGNVGGGGGDWQGKQMTIHPFINGDRE